MSFNINEYAGLTQEEKYQVILKEQIEHYEDEDDVLANVNNTFALLFALMENINWCGIYFYKGGELVLGPFQGFPACTRIALGNGVCGTSAQKRETLVVPDVHDFPGHIACDVRSQSEIVMPILKGGELLGVLDIDAAVKDRFKEVEVKFLNEFLNNLVNNVDLKKLIVTTQLF